MSRAARRRTVLAHAGNRLELVPQPVAQRGESRRLEVRIRQLVGPAHADDLVRGLRAGAQAPFLLAAVKLGREHYVRRYVEHTHAFRATHLVSRQRAEIDRRTGELQRQLARALRRVDVERHAALAA